ncbi:MAG: hypothetical protein N3E47_05990 [Candidatus Bathyarchaeota archaeon]|nr:hypothetical protein [Candidatus Bathyarchaeota archaeon]
MKSVTIIFLEESRMALKIFLNNTSSLINLGDFSLKFFTIYLSSLIIFSLMAAPAPAYTEENPTAFEVNLDTVIRVGDWLAIFILPPVDNLWVKCNASRSSDFRISFSPREIQYGREVSVIYAQIESEGIYSLLVSFYSNNAWNGTIGVYTNNRDFYGKNKPASITSQGYFIELYAVKMMPNENKTANYVINVVLIAQKTTPSGFFDIKLPTPVNAAFFALVSAFVAYINIFFILDSYFKSRSEGVSKVRWALIGLLILVSFYVLYQFYWMILGEG